MAEEDLFLCYIRHVFKKWIGFQAAIDEGMGGPYANEKEIWLGNQVESYFKLYADVKPEDIEGYLGEMLENEFETYFEDGSLRELSIKFCDAYRLSLSNPNAEIFQQMKEVNNSRPNTLSKSKSEGLEDVTPISSMTNGIEHLTVNEEDNSWTTVTRRPKNTK